MMHRLLLRELVRARIGLLTAHGSDGGLIRGQGRKKGYGNGALTLKTEESDQ